MDFLTRFGLSNGRLTVLVMVGLLAQGFLTYYNLAKREDPVITIRAAVVYAQFPGMSPERVEELISIPLERAAREIAEVEDIETLISTGYTMLTVTVFDSVTPQALDQVFQDIRNKMDEAKGELPSGTIGPSVNTNYGDVAIATIAVTGAGFTYPEIWDAADALRTNLYGLKGITKVSFYGEQDERIYLEIDSRKLAAVGVQLAQVLDDLQAQNVILPAGELNSEGTSLILEANGDLGSVAEIGDVLTKVPGLDGFVRVKDLMTVRRGLVDPPEKPVLFSGEQAIVVAVEMSNDQDIQKLGVALKKRVNDFENTQPIGISMRFSTFQETNVTVAIRNALINVGQTFAVVFGVLLLFMGLRSAVIVASIVPFTVMFALIGMQQLGIDLQQVSIAAIIISLGLLVDNGLVIVEDIGTRIKNGATPDAAAVAAGKQFFIPLAVASLTTVSAFFPMLLMEGTEGEYGYSLGMVVAAMLTGSWFTALYILPYLCAKFVKPPKEKKLGENPFVRAYGRITDRALPWSLIVVIASYGLVVLLAGQFSNLKRELFPMSERAEFLIYMNMPKGTAIEETEAVSRHIETWLRDPEVNPEVIDTTVFIGDGGPRFYLALDPADTDPSTAFFLINTDSYQSSLAASDRARAWLNLNHPEARYRVTRLAMGGGEAGIVTLKLIGTDADKLLHLGDQIENMFAQIPDIIYYETDWGNKSLKVVIDIAQDKARELGITSKQISDVMNTYFSGTDYSTYREGDKSIPIVVRAEQGFRDSIEDLANLSIPVNGRLISLDQVAEFIPKLEYSQLRRENQERMIKISGKSASLAADKLLARIQPELDALEMPEGYRLEVGGELETSGDINGMLLGGMPLALTVMLIALMYQFNSVRRVLLTFMTIPLVLIGAPIALEITDRPLSFFAILGLISLMGIIINNAIVLIDQIDLERQKHDLHTALVNAAKKRVTPVLLASTTTVLGLIPMALSGGNLFMPMATLMIGALLVASPITLIFVPCGYYLLFKPEEKWRARREASARSGDGDGLVKSAT